MPAMQAIRLFAPGDMRIVEMPRPQPGPHEVLCRVARVGMCGTDYAIYTGEASFVKSGDVRFPLTLGHEWSALVEETGEGVTRFGPGDRVIGDTGVACGHCNECLLGRYPRCDRAQAVGTVNAWDGAYAEYILMPERHLFPLPPPVSLDNGAMVEPAATALYAVQKAGVQIGDTVLVQGSGPIGILAAKLAKLSGASIVFITGRKEIKLRRALDFGIDAAINTTRESVSGVLRQRVPGGKVDRLIEASGSVELFNESLDLVQPGGAMSVVAFYDRPAEGFDIDRFVFSDITLVAVPGSLGMYPPILSLMAAGLLDASFLITERAPLFAAPDILPRLKENAEGRIKVMLEGAEKPGE
ncbi:MAG: alcohol dehydrogenase catalytic domain-containing protein [Armatimonadetes bacterium]|nr:alcohol dehydrogenase catalytic domain-containing protein [Armatimonadota bacterium]